MINQKVSQAYSAQYNGTIDIVTHFLRKKRDFNKQECSFKFPQPLSEEYHYENEDGTVKSSSEILYRGSAWLDKPDKL